MSRNQDCRAEPYEGICQAVARNTQGRTSAENSGFIVLSSGKMVGESMQRFGTFLSVVDVESGSGGVLIDPLRIGWSGNFTSEF